VSGASGYTGLWASILEFRVFGVAAASLSSGAEAGVVSIASSAPAGDVLGLWVRPNPAVDNATLHYEIKSAGHVKVLLYNAAQGDVILIRDEYLPAGKHESNVDISHLPKGMHVINIIHNGKVSTHKLMKK
jgi:hypothetical protein